MIKAGVRHIVDPHVQIGELRGAMVRTIERKAVRAGLKPLSQAMKSRVPTRTKTLRRALTQKVVTTRKKRVVGVVGPRKKYERVIDGKRVVPAKYAHLVQKGRRAVEPTKAKALYFEGRFSRRAEATTPQDFVAESQQAAGAQAIEVTRTVIAAEIPKQLAKSEAKARAKAARRASR